MTPKDLGAKLEQEILAANKILADGVVSTQDYLYNQIVKVLKDLELDDNGMIIQSQVNRKVIQDAINTIDAKIQTSNYKAQVEQYLGTIPQVDALNITYFTALSDSFRPNRQFLASLQKSTITQIENLLFGSGFESQIKIPLSQILNQNINAGGSFTGMLDAVRSYVKGQPGLDGRLLSYTKQITKDALFNYSRAFHQAVSNDLGLTWFNYSGGLMDKSRPFCIEHAGYNYHYKEIISWVNQDWQGKNPATTESSIFIYVGGFACLHTLIPIDESTVSSEDIQQAKDEGFI